MKTKRLQTPGKFPNVKLNKQVPQHGQFERDIHWKREVGKPLLLRPKRSYWIKEKFPEISTLYRIYLGEANRAKAKMYRPPQLHWKVSSFQAMGSGTRNTQKGSYVFALEVKRLIRGQPYTLHMSSNTWERRDRSVGSIWSRRLSWSAKTFFFPGMYLVIK